MIIVKAFKFGKKWHLGDNASLLRRQFLLPEDQDNDHALIHVHEHELNNKLVIPEHVTIIDLTVAARLVRNGVTIPETITEAVDFPKNDLDEHLYLEHGVRKIKKENN